MVSLHNGLIVRIYFFEPVVELIVVDDLQMSSGTILLMMNLAKTKQSTYLAVSVNTLYYIMYIYICIWDTANPAVSPA